MANSREIIAHTADVRIRITAESLPQLFEMGLKSLNQMLLKNFNNLTHGKNFIEKINLHAPDTTSLLIDFLSEVLTLSQVHKAIFFDFKIDQMTDCRLSGRLIGSKIDAFDEDVKAVTYHEAEVKVNENGDWETVIIFDI